MRIVGGKRVCMGRASPPSYTALYIDGTKPRCPSNTTPWPKQDHCHSGCLLRRKASGVSSVGDRRPRRLHKAAGDDRGCSKISETCKQRQLKGVQGKGREAREKVSLNLGINYELTRYTCVASWAASHLPPSRRDMPSLAA